MGSSRRCRWGVRLASLSFCFVLLFRSCQSADTLQQKQRLSDGEMLVSQGQTFALGFFSPGASTNRYLGIWYHKFSQGLTLVWVANRGNPIPDNSGFLKIIDSGRLVILDGRGNTVWTAGDGFSSNPTLKLWDTGNLVLGDEGLSASRTLWQSFDYPCNTLLPGMKVGLDLGSGVNTMVTSWRNDEDPAPGFFYFGVDPQGSSQFFILKGMYRYWQSGVWNGQTFEGVPTMDVSGYYYNFVSNSQEISFSFQVRNNSTFTRLVLETNGQLKQWNWSYATQNWELFWAQPRDPCSIIDSCGPYGLCSAGGSPFCKCLDGFEPTSNGEWMQGTYSSGCKRITPLNCGNSDTFLGVRNMKLPDNFTMRIGVNDEDCKTRCVSNCSCTAYASAAHEGGGTSCLMWVRNLVDLTEDSDTGHTLFIRVASSKEGTLNKGQLVGILASVTVGVVFVFCCGGIVWGRYKYLQAKRSIHPRQRGVIWQNNMVSAARVRDRNKAGKEMKEGSDVPMFEFSYIEAATNDFSHANKIGEGGFGPVYRGKLAGDQEIAVKRLSRSSGQGIEEFKNEVLLICELQHRNLVKLLGCCIEGEEKLLIYEYMPNRSLDSWLFDRSKRATLDWSKRVQIIAGIARGLLYLHHDSRLRIIHRDLKASNILLDEEMNPKISDFGMARIFGGDQIQAATKRVVGTYGYMSPEYAMKGLFSTKSDVFSFGVLVLEIISGKRNSSSLNLLGHAWKQWHEGEGLELVDPSVLESYSTMEVLKYMHVGLLCVQDSAQDRPTMSSVIIMLESESASLPTPTQPAFYADRSPLASAASSNRIQIPTTNDITISTLLAR